MRYYNIFVYRYVILLIATIAIVFLWRDTFVILGILLILAVLTNFKSSKKEILFYIIVSILATLIESLSISTGAWVYSDQHILNFPIWLPLYWGMGGIAMKDTYLILNKFIKG